MEQVSLLQSEAGPESIVEPQTGCVIQFALSLAFAAEDEGEAVIDVLRLGDASLPASCEYRTQNMSAKAGKKYVASAGTVQFAAGEKSHSIAVSLLNDSEWNATLAFNVILENPWGAHLGKYGNKCGIKIINDDPFPGNRFRQLLLNGQEGEVSGFCLMWSYIRLMFQNSCIRRDTLKCVVLDQMKGLYFFVCVYLQMYLVDVVLNPHHDMENMHHSDHDGGGKRLLLSGIHGTARLVGRILSSNSGSGGNSQNINLGVFQSYIPDDRREVAFAIGLLYVAPFVLLHLIDIHKCYLSLPCEIRKVLQGNLMRQFLNYKQEIRNNIKHSEVIMVMIRDVIEVADKGYMKVLNILRITGKLGFALIFIMNENKVAAIPLVVYPIILSCWLCIRHRRTAGIHEAKESKQDEMVESVEYAAQHYNLISDFHMREPVSKSFEDSIDDFHNIESEACAINTNNSYAAPWLTTLFVGCGYACSAFVVSTVSAGTLSLGAFLASINVFKEVGAEISDVYIEVMDFQLSLGPLLKITHYMNCPTDLLTRMSIARKRQKEGRLAREEARSFMTDAQKASGEFAVDSVQLAVQDLSFSYGFSNTEKLYPVLEHVNIKFDQGKLYAFVGPPREGKATFLKLLGCDLYPQGDSGDIFIPPHLRVLHCSRTNSILRKASFLDNILMGSSLQDVGGIARVKSICKRLGFPERMLDKISEDEAGDKPTGRCRYREHTRSSSWSQRLSNTDYSRLNLARVFCENPEILVMHKPAADFDDRERCKIIHLLREHVDEKGLDLPPESKRTRRPRTLFFTSSTILGIQTADCVFKVSLKDGIHPIPKENVGDALLM